MKVDLFIKNGRVATPQGILKAGIGIFCGKITSLTNSIDISDAERIIDAEGKVILPGVIDAHVHFREPGRTEGEDFETGTRAAAAGGVTTVFEMPLSIPCVANAEVLKEREVLVKKKAVVDFGLYGGAGAHNINEIEGLARAGAIGFKTYLHAPPKGREIEYEGAYVTDDGTLFEILEKIMPTGLTSTIHAENNAIIDLLTKRLTKLGRRDAMAHPESRPNFVEEEAINKVLILAKIAGTRLHIAHLSTREGLYQVEKAKTTGQRVTVETCPHYLTLTAESMKSLGPYAKINPPLRSKSDMEELWKGLSSGIIDIVVSDHAPYTKIEKEKGLDNIWEAPAGAPTIETMLPLLLNGFNEGKISLERLVQATSVNVAKIFGLYPLKGVIQIGSDADLTIVDLNLSRKVDVDKMYSKARENTPYKGWILKGCQVMTIVRGEIVMDDGEVLGKVGYGDFVSPIKIGRE